MLMGSDDLTSETVVDYLNKQKGRDYKVGVLKVNLFRPWSEKHLLNSIPKSVTKITVLDKTRDEAAKNPMYLDTLCTIKTNRPEIEVYGGTYGLSGKPFTPN